MPEMKFNFTDKDIRVLKVVSQISGGFTLIVALTMIFSLIQLNTIKPLDSPVLLQIKEQYDKDPSNSALGSTGKGYGPDGQESLFFIEMAG